MPGEPTLVNTFLRETRTGVIYSLSETEKTLIGRALDCQIVLNSPQDVSISRYHAEVCPLAESGGWEICDRDSNNGTYVNGKRLSGCQILQPGDRLTFGESPAELIFEVQAAEIATEGQKNPPIEPKKSLFSAISPSTWFPLRSKWRELLEEKGAIKSAISHLLLGMLDKPFWLILTLILVTCGLTAVAARLWPNLILPPSPPKIETIAIAVLLKELIKALPVLLLSIWGRKLPFPWRDRLAIRNPLDGILLAAACALGAVLFYTLAQNNIPELLINQKTPQETLSPTAEFLDIIIKPLLATGCDLAYSGIFGYYLGLSAMRSPRKRCKLIGSGYFLASIFHFLVELSAQFLAIQLQYILKFLVYFVFAAFFLKGRDLSN